MDKLISISMLALVVMTTAYTDVYYVSIDGKPESGGTIDKSWHSVEYAL